MSKISVSSKALKTGLTIAKIVKPVLQDFSLEISPSQIRIFSMDRKRSVLSHVPVESKSHFAIEDCFLPMDRTSLLESDYESCTMSFSDKGVQVKYSENGKVKTALIKRRAVSSKRPPIPEQPDFADSPRINAKIFSRILNQVSASAQVKQTKTEEDARINQIHFYRDHHAVTSNARYYASCVYHDSITFDVSIVSNDIPYIESFLSRCDSDVAIWQDDFKTWFIDPQTGNLLIISKVSTKRPDFKPVSVGDAATVVECNCEEFKTTLNWAGQAIEGTPRCSFRIVDSQVELSYNLGPVGSLPVKQTGADAAADYPIKVLETVFGYFEGQTFKIHMGIPNTPSIMVWEQSFSDTTRAFHYIAPMR